MGQHLASRHAPAPAAEPAIAVDESRTQRSTEVEETNDGWVKREEARVDDALLEFLERLAEVGEDNDARETAPSACSRKSP